MQRIAIIGTSGSGKTTLGKMLGKKLGIPSVDLDDLSWEPNWTIASEADFDHRLGQALEMSQWVISGNYSRIQQRYLARADTLIWLDYSFPLVYSRVLKRTFSRIVWRVPCCNGNTESLRRTFSRESILLWVLTSYKRRRTQGLKLIQSNHYPHLRKIRFRSPLETKRWLDSL